MMRRILLIATLLTATLGALADDIISRTEGSITFTVDGQLPAPRQTIRKVDSKQIANIIIADQHVPPEYGKPYVAASFEYDTLSYETSATMFHCLRLAYADHRPVMLSPDMVWLLISQGFSRYVNAHAEQLRNLLVSHDGKQELAVQTNEDLLLDDVNWNKLMQEFTSQISLHTKGDIAQTITTDFSTTTPADIIASQVTLMDLVKSYFDYTVYHIVCGIPYITLQGTPDDWKLVLSKTRQLRQYGLDKWVTKLVSVLTEFIKAAEGRPNRSFWQNIVRRKRVGELRGGGCIHEKPTMLDGWFLTLFPDENGQTKESVIHSTRDMPSEMVRVGFKYKTIAPTGEVVSETPMELWAGFIGIEEDTTTHALTPRIGWMARVANADEEAVHRLYMQDKLYGKIYLQVKEVPLALSQLETIKSLDIEFTDRVVLPAWLDHIKIERLTVTGMLTDEETAALRRRFPHIRINP